MGSTQALHAGIDSRRAREARPIKSGRERWLVDPAATDRTLNRHGAPASIDGDRGMFRLPWRRKPARPPLPDGLRWCETCGEPRGATPAGRVSACYCSGLICNRCDERIRRPISDYYEVSTPSRGADAGVPIGRWWHVPWFALQGHSSSCSRTHPEADGFTTLEPDPDVRAYQEAITRRSLEQMRRNDEARVAPEVRTGLSGRGDETALDDGPTIQFGAMPGIMRLPPDRG